ncbi:MAG: restriction endonuclease [Alphaproteobacteria bacterium]|nr:restriction endonuclease [Alphaproteobacteria bacterium]
MPLANLLANPDWDQPFFKKLASNDTGSASGHQGGMVIPQDLRNYFPGLSGNVSSINPTLDHRIRAELFIEDKHIATVSTRYQFQTWGGTRSPESRITDKLGPIRDKARGNDYLVVQRNLEQLDFYRLILVRQSSTEYSMIVNLANGKRWGVLGVEKPMSATELEMAEKLENEREVLPFQLFDSTTIKVESRSFKIARSIAFRLTIQRVYSGICAACGTSLRSPEGPIELDAAHIVPRSMSGTDDARNGLGLCKRHHWAFDHGLFSVDESRNLFVPRSVRMLSENKSLSELHGTPMRESIEPDLYADDSALDWHRNNVLIH